ncbi:hypothetical protein [Rhodopseudomonas palustris]
MPLTDLINAFQQNVIQQNGVMTGADLARLRTLLTDGTLGELRIFIGASSGLGHQASSINILKRMIGFGCAGPIRVVYEVDADDPNLPKLAVLLPGFNPNNPGAPYQLNGVNLVFTAYQAGTPLGLAAARLAICGGSELNVNMTAADRLNVDAYLQLQPFQWPLQDNLLWQRPAEGQQERIVLNAVPALGPGFVDRAFYMPEPTVSDQEWDTLFDSFPNQEQLHIAELIDGFMQPDTDKQINFLPVYGIGDTAGGSISTLTGRSWGILYSLTAAVAYAQQQGDETLQRPTVIGVVSRMQASSWADFTLAVNGQLNCPAPDGSNSFQLAMTYATANGLPQRVRVQSTSNSAAFLAAVDALQNNEILVVAMPDLPPDVFNLMYGIASLPFVFEGKGTANLALNLGMPYIHMARGGVSVYPTTFLGGGQQFVAAMSANIGVIVAELQQWLSLWPANQADTPAARIGTYIIQSITLANGPYQQYFTSISTFYHAEQNDKLLMSLIWSLQQLPVWAQQQQLAARRAALARADAESPLQQFYNTLTANVSSGVLNLIPGALNTGIIFDLLTKIIGSDSLSIGSGLTAVTISFSSPYDKITVTGPTLSFGSGSLASDIVFTAGETLESLTAALTLHGKDFSFEGAPWFTVDDTSIAVTVADSGQRIQGEVTGLFMIGKTPVSVSFAYPAGQNELLFKGDFGNNPPGFNELFQLLGGINFLPTLPPPLNLASNLTLKGIQLAYDYSRTAVTGLNVNIATAADWPIFGKVALQKGAMLTVAVASPTGSRQVSWLAAGTITIGKGRISLGISYPDISMTAQMEDGSRPIPLGDFLTFFLPPSYTLDLSANVTLLTMSVQPVKTPVYAVSGALDTDWPIEIAGVRIFTLTGLSMDVNGTGSNPTGSITAETTMFIGQPTEFRLAVTAAYLGSGKWQFSGTLSQGTISVVDILRTYLPAGWIPTPAPKIDITAFNAKIASSGTKGVGNSYEVGGTVKVWDVPFLKDINFESTIIGKFGYLAAGAPVVGMGVARVPISPELFPIVDANGRHALVRAVEGGAAKPGYYGEIAALITWSNIKLRLAYSFEPNYQCYLITWGIFTGKLEEKLVDQKPHWIASIGFTEGTTLGGMIETFISWATGSRFGLAAPWNVLNSISLSNFSLVFDITAGTVSFQINIGPIEMGFARLTAISVQYNNDKANPKDNGVRVNIVGEFRWQDNPSQPLNWDAAKPETTPAPPGGGNKYIDIRLLALGQHVTASCFPTSKTVQQAIACMATLPPPKAGEIPPIQFDASSNWLIGMDFGVLKIEDDEKGGYVVTLQIVFNDPNLYGLRLALEGSAAKIFKGLDFQIMYRKISDNLGVYQAEIALPAIMRKFQTGVFTITLPIFAIQVYTNGDFLIDIGFPWNENFARSFTIEAIVPPGIPLIGGGGIYFGKLSSATSTAVPAVTNGTFNPVIVFGFGAQLGLGKSVEIGILSAGFSLTVFGIIEGVLAKWNPYTATNVGTSGNDQLQGQYFFSLSGTMGIIGLLYGTVDFAIIKASVRIEIKIYAQIVFASYQDIPITVAASVDVTAEVTINLGLFKIHLSFSFSARVKETFVLTTAHDSPWHLASPQAKALPRMARPLNARLGRRNSRRGLRTALQPVWSNLSKPAAKAALAGYCAAAPTIAGDQATQLSQQLPCYILSIFIDSVKSASADPHSSARKAAGEVADTPFELLAKRVAQWAIAAIGTEPMSPGQVDKAIVTPAQLDALLQYLSDTTTNPTPIPRAAIDAFLSDQVSFALHAPPTTAGEADVAYFPMPVALELNVPAYGSAAALKYSFTDYNSITDAYLLMLRDYFNELAVKVEGEQKAPKNARLALANGDTSMADFIFTDYFLLVMRQVVQALQDGLRDYKYPIQSSQTCNDVVTWVNTTGKLSGDDAYTLADLFADNGDHALAGGKTLAVNGTTYAIQPGDSFVGIAGDARFGSAFDATQLATLNAETAGVIAGGKTYTYNASSYTTLGADTLSTLAETFGTTVADLLANSDIRTNTDLLAPLGAMHVPAYPVTTATGDTLTGLAGKLGVSMLDLAATDNGAIAGLFDPVADPYLDIAHLPQFEVGALIQEAQRALALQQLSGMVSRYYFHGMRLPTSGITPNAIGMWVTDQGGQLKLPDTAGLFALTGQQIALPTIVAPNNYTITLNGFTALGWMTSPGGNSFTLTVTPDSVENAAITALTNYARGNALDIPASGLGAGQMVASAAATYPLASPIIWQSTAGIALPYAPAPAAPKTVNLWMLPNAMVALPDPTTRAINPRFTFSVERYDQASATTVSTPVVDYGLASAVGFSVKKVPDQGASSPASSTTYEIVGAGGQDVVVLERLLAAIGGNDSAIFQITLGFASSSTGGTSGIESAAADRLTLGISQVNLSTVTRPPGARQVADAEAPIAAGPTVLNKPTEFIRLLWEASITRSGGFFLYYFDGATGSGLPDRIFNDKGEAPLTMIVTYAKPSQPELQNAITNYINAVIIGDAVDLSDASIVATSAGVVHTITTGTEDSLGGIATRYFAQIADVAAAAAPLQLASKATPTVENGVYFVSPLATAAERDPDAIARRFGITLNQLKDANPAITSWQNPLPLYTGLRLPDITLAIGSSPGGTTLAAIAAYYGTTVVALAVDNAELTGLLAANQALTVVSGPTVLSSTVTAGVQSTAAHRPMPMSVPSDPAAPGYAVDFLTNAFSLLGYLVAANQDFKASNMGLPAGPQAPTGNVSSKMLRPRALADGGSWDYTLSIPYTGLSKTGGGATGVRLQANDSPYRGNGSLLQLNFSWQDLYGNLIITTLSNPAPASNSPLNRSPILIGYTDALVGLARWPSVSSGWSVLPAAGGGQPTLAVDLSFSPTAYQSPEENPDGTKSWRQNAIQALPTYVTLLYQLTDPKGVALTLATSLLADEQAIPSTQVAGLLQWLQAIFAFIQDRADGNKAVAVPPPSPTPAIRVPFNPADIVKDQIFLLTLDFVMARTGGVFEGDCGALDGVRRVATGISPTGDQDGSASLTGFAAGLRQALSTSAYSINAATGIDRTQPSAGRAAPAISAVRLGTTIGEPIHYSLRNPGKPIVLAPRPISNVLISRNNVPIYDYVSGVGIDFSEPSHMLDFSNIDYDVWMSQLFAAVDTVLTPVFTSAILLVDGRTKDPVEGGYLGQLLASKEALASSASTLMVAVYKDQTADEAGLIAAREAFYQEMLVALGNAYSVHAAIEFLADVKADARDDDMSYPPNLYGSVSGTMASTVSFTAAKLALQTTSAAEPAVLVSLVTAPGVVKNADGSVQQVLSVTGAKYDGISIEHQISDVPGIQDYKASSWLAFVEASAGTALSSQLGNFDVPLVLRSFPTTPAMTDQSGAQSHPDATELANLLEWTYQFTYSLDFHYPQDRIYAEVIFNVAEGGLRAMAVDAFGALAEFVTVYPSVAIDLNGILAKVDATTVDPATIAKATVAIKSFNQLVDHVATFGDSMNLVARGASRSHQGSSAAKYDFIVSEAPGRVEGYDYDVLVVTIDGAPPEGISPPTVTIAGYKTKTFATTAAAFSFYFVDSDEKPLSNALGQAIGDRTVLLAEMQVLQRQDAWSCVLLKRNEFLGGRAIADAFVYTTPEVKFAAPYHPVVGSSQPVQVAELGSLDGNPVTRSLQDQLTAVFAALLKNYVADTITVQMECSYSYAINPALSLVSLPVVMQPPTTVAVAAGPPQPQQPDLAGMIATLSGAIELWFDANEPHAENGQLDFVLTIMSSMTVHPMPLVRLDNLQLPIIYVDPPLKTR